MKLLEYTIPKPVRMVFNPNAIAPRIFTTNLTINSMG